MVWDYLEPTTAAPTITKRIPAQKAIGAQKNNSTASSPIGSKMRRRSDSPATQAEKVAKRERRKMQAALVSCLAVIGFSGFRRAVSPADGVTLQKRILGASEKGSFFSVAGNTSPISAPAGIHAGMSRAVIPSLCLVSKEANGGGMAVAGRLEWSRPDRRGDRTGPAGPAGPGNRCEPLKPIGTGRDRRRVATPGNQTMPRDVSAMSRPVSRRGLASPRPLFPTLRKRNKLAFRAIGKRNLYARAHRPQMQSGCVLRYDSRQATFRGSK